MGTIDLMLWQLVCERLERCITQAKAKTIMLNILEDKEEVLG